MTERRFGPEAWFERRITAPLLLGIFLAARALGLTAPAAVTGFALAALVPGLALVRLVRGVGESPIARLAVAMAWSIPAEAAIATLLSLAGVPLPVGLALVVVAAVVVLAWPRRAAAEAPPQAEPIALWLIASASALLVFAMAVNPWVREWSDAWFHVAVYREVLRAGLPPDFPHFAGQPLPYPWLFHAWLVALDGWLGIGARALMPGLNIFTAVALPVSIYALARGWGASMAGGIAAALAMMIGINPFGAIVPVLRAAVGEHSGLPALLDQIRGTNAVMMALAFQFRYFDASLWARLGTSTAFNFALVLCAAAFMIAGRSWRGPQARGGLALAITMACLFLWHTLTAYAVGIGLAAACALGLAWAWMRGGAPERRTALVGGLLVAVAGIAGYALAFPYLKNVTQGASGAQMMRLGLSREGLVALVIAAGPVVGFALAALLRGRDEVAAQAWRAGLVAGIASGFLLFDLPGSAEEKLFYPLFVAAAALAGGPLASAWARGGPWRAGLATTALGGLIATAFVVWSFATDDRPVRTLFAEGTPVAERFTGDEAAALHWIEQRSPHDAVFLQEPRPLSNEPILVEGGRRLFLGPAQFFYRAIFFPTADRPPVAAETWAEVARRDTLQRAVFSDQPLTGAELSALRAYPFPLYVWQDARLGTGRVSPTVGDSAAFETVFRSGGVILHGLIR